jgi:hypothetical protein
MAVLTVTGVPVSGVRYTVTTASSTDWASVSNSTYFFDLTDKLVYYKTPTGAITYGFNNSANRILRINNQIGTSYTLAIDDFNFDTITTMNNASTNTVTVPPSVFPIGAQLLVAQEGLGQTSFVAGAGVTINAIGLSISSRYKSVALIQVALNEWDAYGTLDASLYTARTSAFATATGITDTTILGALNTFDLGLISNSLDTKMKAVYPFVGTTSTTQKFNFMDARDLDVAFRLQFFGGGTFSSNGFLPNGTNAFANTNLNALSILTSANNHISYYSRTNPTPINSIEMGISSNFGYYAPAMRIRLDGFYGITNQLYYVGGSSSDNATVSSTNTDARGHFIGNTFSTTNRKTFKNGSVSGTNISNVANSLGNGNIYIAANNTYDQGNIAQLYTNRECAFSSIGDALTDGEATTFYNLVQTMQVSLSRAV